jgi:hypothetical protein
MPTYPDLSEQLRETLAAHAARAGSKANSLRGWIRAAHRDVPRRRAALSRPAVEPLYTRGMHRYEREAAVAAWRARCTVRTSDREAKRARHDVAFRLAYAARLAREQVALRRPPARETLREWSVGYVERARRLAELGRLRALVTGTDRPVSGLISAAMPPRRLGIPLTTLVPLDEGAAVVGGWKPYGRVPASRREYKPSAGPSMRQHTPGESKYRGGGSWSTVTRATVRDYVTSVAVIDADDYRTVHYLLHQTQHAVTLPDGWSWQTDALGLLAVRPDGQEHHVTAGDLLAPNAIPSLVEAAAQMRATAAAEERALEATLGDVYVCVADSLRGGNCRAGTEAWAAQRELSPAQHVPARVLRRLAGSDDAHATRVRLAVRAAAARHADEVAQGYCDVAAHRVGGGA